MGYLTLPYVLQLSLVRQQEQELRAHLVRTEAGLQVHHAPVGTVPELGDREYSEPPAMQPTSTNQKPKSSL